MLDPEFGAMDNAADDVDRLFARLERAPAPDDLAARVLASTVARKHASRAVFAWPWIVAGLVALGLLTIAGYQLGASLASNDGLDLLAGIAGDLGLVATSPGDVLAALGEVVPWSLIVLACLSATMLNLAAGKFMSRPQAPLRSRRPA
jgi:hypothetical protein